MQLVLQCGFPGLPSSLPILGSVLYQSGLPHLGNFPAPPSCTLVHSLGLKVHTGVCPPSKDLGKQTETLWGGKMRVPVILNTVWKGRHGLFSPWPCQIPALVGKGDQRKTPAGL